MADELPLGLDRQRHVEGGNPGIWPRRAGVLLAAALCVLGLLNVFGQRAEVHATEALKVSVSVDSPDALRGGLIFTTRITVTANQAVNDLHMVLSPGWLDGMTLNGIAPQSNTQTSTDRGLDLDYQQLQAGSDLVVWVSWQVNPTTVGARDQDLTLLDGTTQILSLHRRATVYP
jgi:hypothetical protein